MRTLTRTVVTWLLMLAILAQSHATAAMVFCESGHPHSTVGSFSPHLPAAHAHADDSFVHRHRHSSLQTEQSGHDISIAMARTEQGSNARVDLAKTKKIIKTDGSGKCSACASCCNGTAMVSTFPAFAVQLMPSVLNTTPSVGVVGFIPPGLERPPRPWHA